MRIGVRGHDIVFKNCSELKMKIKDYGFNSIQLVLKKTFKTINFSSIEDKDIADIAASFKDIDVCMLGAYFNMVHSNKEMVVRDIDYFKLLLRNANLFNCLYVGSETGSYNDTPWTYVEKNHTIEGYNEVLKVIRELVSYSRYTDAYVAIEGAWNHIIYSPEVMKELIDDVNDEKLKVIVDVYNYLNINNYQDAYNIFKKCLDLFKDKIVIFHIKDFIEDNGKLVQVAIGKGIMPLNKIVEDICTYCPNSSLIFEGSLEKDMIDSLKYIKGVIENE